MKKISSYILLMLLLLTGFLPRLAAQNPGVLHIKQNSYHTYFDLGMNLKTDLLDAGNAGEATLEFWVKSAQAGNPWTLTDMNPDNDHFSVSMASENQLTIQLAAQSHTLDLAGVVGSGVWHHIALVVSQNSQVLEVYVNGLKKGQFNMALSNGRELYFYKPANAELFITEIRGWSKKRSLETIGRNQWRSFVTQSPSGLTSLKNNEGLRVFYGNDDYQTASPMAGIDEISRVSWKNIQSTAYSAGCISDYGVQSIAAVRTDTDHPVFNLNQILVRATKGEFSNKIQLEWPHVKDVNGYNIYRNDQLIATQPATGINVSDLLTYNDPSILPADMNSYRVEGYKNADPAFSIEGTDQGFIFPNGKISGNIATQSSVFVENVELRAVGATPTGSALQFSPGNGPITVSNVEVFRNQAAFTVEFWYKGTANPSGTPFQLGGATITFTTGTINVTNGNGASYISAPASGDSQWHHYSVVFTSTGGALYRDGVELATNTVPFAIDLSAVDNFKLNASSAATAWQLDELRIWNAALDAETIASRYDHILSGSEQNLALYYRFDLGDANNMYNQANATKGSYMGDSVSGLNWLTAADQPGGLAYGAFTDANGNYTLSSVNAGTDPAGLNLTITPSKPNHIFNPANRGITILRSLNSGDYEKTAHFTDISELPIAGKVLYQEAGQEYPVPSGQTITLDGQPVVGADPGLVTDAFGVFSISAPLGLHEIAVDNPLTSHSMGVQSLYFDGIDDYAETEKVIDFQRNGTFSGWLKKGTATAGEQTILQVGDLRVVLKNNQTLAVKEGNTEVVTASDQVGTDWHFFALTYNETTKQAILYSGMSFYQNTLTAPNLNGKLILGAAFSPTAGTFYQGNIHLIEYRDSLYNASLIGNLRLGDYIPNDEASLWFSFRFPESAGELLRSVSLAPGAADYVLVCDGPVIDTQTINTYTRKTRYDYHAEGPYANAEKQVFNVINPETNLRFYNDTRYGVVGNLVIPCGYNVGAWDVRVERTDIVSPHFEKTTATFNDTYTVFVVDGLLPGQYKVYLTNNQGASSIELESGVLDITRGWVTQEFEYRAPMNLDMLVTAVVDNEEQLEIEGQPMLSLSTTPYDMTNYCNGTYIMESGKGYVVALSTYEQYGEDRCYIQGVQYDIDGDLAHVVAQTAGTGRDTLLIKALEPNFVSPFTRSLQLTATHDGRVQQQNLNAYITGAKQFSSDFTLEAPPEIVAVLHDSPGDGSSATLSKGTSFSFSESITHTGGADISVDVSTGVDTEHYTGNFAGLGAGVIFLTKIVDSKASALFKVAESFKLGDTDSKNYELSLNQTISTSSAGTLPGYPSDVYVGYSPIIHIGTGKRLRMEGCTPVSEDNIDAIKPDRTPLFSLTHQHIKDVTIPNLELLRDATANTDSIQMYQGHIDGWLNILAANEANWNNAQNLPQFQLRNTETGQILSFENSIAFSAGQSISYSLGERNVDGSKFTAESNTSLSKTFSKSFSAFGVAVNLKIEAKGFYNYLENSEHTTTNGRNFGFTLTDDDIGDQFDVLIRKDTAFSFATPIFKAVAGRSMCPVERNTQPREGVQMTSDKAVGFAGLDEQAVFYLTLANTQVANEEAGTGFYKNFRIKAYDSQGAILRYNGGLLNESGQLVVLDTQGPQAIKDSIPLTVERNPANPGKVDFEDISIVFFSECENSGNSLRFYDGFAGVKLVDTLHLSARFHRPCVETIAISQPAPNWVVNQTSNNELTFKFSIDNPEASFDKLLVEYANQGNNTPHLLQEVDPATLTPDANGDYTLTVNVSGISDGEYQFRLTPQCGLGTEPWRSETSSEWVSGSIYRILPVITEVYPPHNSVMTSGTISASYDRDLSPAGVNSLNISLRGILGGYEYIPKSADFNELTDQITIPNQPAINLGNAYTVEFWINPSAYANNGDKVPVIEKGSNLGIYLTHDGKIDNGRSVSTAALIPFKWTHVAVVYDGVSTVKTYFDTQLVAENPIAPAYVTNTDDLTIGTILSGDAFRGQLDEVRIWNTARSVAEIATDRNRRLLGNEDHLMAYYVLDDIALEGEGVRDFTGKTSGTIATDISWVEGDAAAPIVVEKVVQDVPINAILSGGNQILITPKPNFPDQYIEGAELTAFIAGSKIEDLYGNSAPGTSWSFVVNKNAVQWAQNNYTLNQSEGVASTFNMNLTNNGAINVTYEFTNLPVWLSVSNDPGNGTLPYGFTRSISFATAQWLNPGKHETYVKATILDPNGGVLGVESFFLEVNVSCPAPAYSFNSNQYPDQISLTASLTVAGELSQDVSDKVYAYLNGTLRGIGQLNSTGGQYRVSMLIYGNFGDSGALTFRVWDASDCKEYQGVLESYSYQGGVNIGSLANPVTLTTGEVLSKSLSLPSGFHWVSFNLADTGQSSLSLSALSGFNTGDSITDQQGNTATYNAASGWSGALTTLDYKRHYSVYLSQPATLELQGLPVSENTDIPVVSGTSWAGYIPEQMIQTGRAVISLSNTTATNGDQVQGKEGFAEFLNGAWIGTLTHLTPNRGYRIIAAQAGTLNYFGIAGYGSKDGAVKSVVQKETPSFDIREKAMDNGWQADENDYPEVMYMTGVIEGNDVNPQTEHIIGAFSGNECRGVAIPQLIDGKLYYFMTVYGHTDTETLIFRMIDGDTEKQYLLNNRLEFRSGKSEGSYNDPYKWQLSKEQQKAGSYQLYQSYPNPFSEFTTIGYELPQASEIQITILDMKGRILKTLVKGMQPEGNYQVKWYGDDNHGVRLSSGIYFVIMQTNGGTLQHKVILK